MIQITKESERVLALVKKIAIMIIIYFNFLVDISTSQRHLQSFSYSNAKEMGHLLSCKEIDCNHVHIPQCQERCFGH